MLYINEIDLKFANCVMNIQDRDNNSRSKAISLYIYDNHFFPASRVFCRNTKRHRRPRRCYF